MWGWLSRVGATASSQVGSEYFHQNDGGLGLGAVRDSLARTGEGWRSQEARGSGHIYTFSTRPRVLAGTPGASLQQCDEYDSCVHRLLWPPASEGKRRVRRPRCPGASFSGPKAMSQALQAQLLKRPLTASSLSQRQVPVGVPSLL